MATKIIDADQLDALWSDMDALETAASDLPDWEAHPGQKQAIDAYHSGRNVLILAGRQWGKTSVGMRILVDELTAGGRRGAICLPHYSDVKKFTDELTLRDIPFEHNRIDQRIRLGGVRSFVDIYTSQRPDNIRGAGYHIALMDELAYWEYPDRMFQSLRPTLYVRDARWICATTPPVSAASIPAHDMIEYLVGHPNVTLVGGPTSDNPAIPRETIPALLEEAKSLGERNFQIEWEGKHILTPEGSLFPQDVIDLAHTDVNLDSDDAKHAYTVISVDPTVSEDGGNHEAGIVVCAAVDGVYYVIDDVSGHLPPEAWASRAVGAYHERGANVILVEKNQGGAMVKSTIHHVDPTVYVETVDATESKVGRASPISALYRQGKVKHVRPFETLEKQMLLCVPGARKSYHRDDRLDAMVHGIQWLTEHAIPDWDMLWVNKGWRDGAGELHIWDGDRESYNRAFRARTPKEMRSGVTSPVRIG